MRHPTCRVAGGAVLEDRAPDLADARRHSRPHQPCEVSFAGGHGHGRGEHGRGVLPREGPLPGLQDDAPLHPRHRRRRAAPPRPRRVRPVRLRKAPGDPFPALHPGRLADRRRHVVHARRVRGRAARRRDDQAQALLRHVARVHGRVRRVQPRHPRRPRRVHGGGQQGRADAEAGVQGGGREARGGARRRHGGMPRDAVRVRRVRVARAQGRGVHGDAGRRRRDRGAGGGRVPRGRGRARRGGGGIQEARRGARERGHLPLPASGRHDLGAQLN